MEDKIYKWVHKDLNKELSQELNKFYELLKGNQEAASLLLNAELVRNETNPGVKIKSQGEGTFLSMLELQIEVFSHSLAVSMTKGLENASLKEAMDTLTLASMSISHMATFNLLMQLHEKGLLAEDENGDFELINKKGVIQ